jgi:hypothetical protein
MHATDTPETLPPATTLGRSAQWRWLGIAAAVLVGIGLLVSLIGKLTHHDEAPPPASPASRPTQPCDLGRQNMPPLMPPPDATCRLSPPLKPLRLVKIRGREEM